jgi:predicted amidohydrolase YtcJ
VKLLVNGAVLTMDAARPRAEALALQDDRLAAVGSNEEILRLRTPDVEVLDLAGKTALPGFVDAHNHFSTAALDVSLRHGSRRQVVDEGQAVPAQAALEAYTISAARAGGLERECGSLEAGKRADLIVLDRNPLTVPPGELSRLKVVKTFVAGQEVFP